MITPAVVLPAAFVESQRSIRGEHTDRWLEALVGHVGDVLARWRLTADGPVWHGFCAVVLPVTAADGRQAALKVGHQDADTRTEVPALRTWDGHGAVRLLDADRTLDPAEDDGVGALLLERLDAERSLHDVGDDEGAEVTGTLLARLAAQRPAAASEADRPDQADHPDHADLPDLPDLPDQADHADHPDLADLASIPTLADRAAEWIEELPRAWESLGRPCDRRLLDAALDTCRSLGPEPAESLVHVDLHQANVLAATREPWLAIDPQAMFADPAFCLVPFLRNNWKVVAAGPDPHAALLRRFDVLVESAGLDPSRAAAWTLARSVSDLFGAVRYGDNEGISRPVATAIAEWMLPSGLSRG